jgi:hypothetical protein
MQEAFLESVVLSPRAARLANVDYTAFFLFFTRCQNNADLAEDDGNE